MRSSVKLEKGIYNIDDIKYVHNSDSDWLSDVSFLDYKRLQNHLNSKQDLELIFNEPDLAVDYPAFQLWIIVDAKSVEEGERKARELESSLRKAGLQTRYDQIVFGPKALLTCTKLKAKEPCDDEIAEDFEPETPVSSSEVPLRPLSPAPRGEALTVPTHVALPPAPGATALPEATHGALPPAPRASALPEATHGALPPAPRASALPESTGVSLPPAPGPTALPAATHGALPPAPRTSALPEPTRVSLPPAPRASALPEVTGRTGTGAVFGEDNSLFDNKDAGDTGTSADSIPEQAGDLPAKPSMYDYPRDFLFWLFSAGPPTSLLESFSILKLDNHRNAIPPLPSLVIIINAYFLCAYRFDGYDPITNMITSADGKTKPYTDPKIPFWLMLASFLGLPSRAESVVDGVPQFSGWQLLKNLFGVWISIKETLTNKNGNRSFYQYRWTEKKIVQGIFLLFKLIIIFPLKLILMPFKIMLNIIKLVTEVFIPMITFYTSMINAKLFLGLIKYSFQRTENKFFIGTLIFFGMIPLVAMAIIQYAMVWASRLGLAFTSPEMSARNAFALGYNLTIGKVGSTGQKIISYVVGGIGAIVSLTLSGVLWTIALPLAFSALVTAIPSLLTAVTWISQLPFVATSLAWLSQWPLLTKLSLLLNSAVSTVGGGLGIAFGPIITPLATAMSLQISAAVMTVGTFLGMIAIPIAAILSRAADELSNLWALWVEQKPFTSFGRWISRSESNNSKGSMPNSAPEKIFAYQAEAGREYIISTQALNLRNRHQKILEGIEVTGEKAEALFLRAKENKEHKSNEKARFPTPVEQRATLDIPVLVR